MQGGRPRVLEMKVRDSVRFTFRYLPSRNYPSFLLLLYIGSCFVKKKRNTRSRRGRKFVFETVSPAKTTYSTRYGGRTNVVFRNTETVVPVSKSFEASKGNRIFRKTICYGERNTRARAYWDGNGSSSLIRILARCFERGCQAVRRVFESRIGWSSVASSR